MKKGLICFLGLVSAGLFGQGIPYGQEFRVNNYTNGDPRYPSVAALAGGGFVVCWVRWGQDGTDRDVYGQMFGKSGEKKNGEFLVTPYTEDDQSNPSVTALAGGGFVVCWDNFNQNGSRIGVYGQMFNESGVKKNGEFQVNTYRDNIQWNPRIAGLAGGGFVVCWESWHQDGFGFDVYGQMFNASGVKKNSEFQVNIYKENYQTNPSVAAFAGGGFVVCWENYYQNGSRICIYGQMFDKSGVKKNGEFQVNTYMEGYQSNPSVAALAGGGFFVCWLNLGQDCPYQGVYGQIFDESGVKKNSEFQVNTYKEHYQTNPSVTAVTALAGGGFVVCWENYYQNGSRNCVYGQIFDESGVKKNGEFQVNTYTEDQQFDPRVAALAGGGFVVCWESIDQDGSRVGIFGKCFPESPLIHTLKPFSLLEPVNDSSIHTIYPNLKWQNPSDQIVCYPWELHYKVFVDENFDFSSPQIIEQDQDTTLTLNNLQPSTTYFWKVLAKNIAGDSLWSSNVNGFYVSPDATDVERETKIPEGFVLEQNYPNPFNPSTEIKYSIPSNGFVMLKIYDIQGRLIRVLCDGVQNAGFYSVRWDGKNKSGQDVSSGIYPYKLSFKNAQGQTTVISRKMGLVR